MTTIEHQLEEAFIEKPRRLQYEHREDIRDRAAPEQNFREKIETLNGVRRTGGEFPRLLKEIITPDVCTTAGTILCCFPLCIVSNRHRTCGGTNNNARHFGSADQPRRDLTGTMEGKLPRLVPSQNLFTVQ